MNFKLMRFCLELYITRKRDSGTYLNATKCLQDYCSKFLFEAVEGAK